MKSLRLKSALTRLKQQLIDGVKTEKGTVTNKIPLTEKDTERIKKEK